MRCNIEQLVARSARKPCLEGRLNYRKIVNNSYYQNAFKERWFKLVDNFLFYFRINEFGKVDEKSPVGVFILENASIQLEGGFDTAFAFTISYVDEPEKKHLFSGRSEDVVSQWVEVLRQASYEYLRSQLYTLQKKLYSKTGKDPLLMVPRNAGSMKFDLELNHKCNDSKHNSTTHIFKSKSSANIPNTYSTGLSSEVKNLEKEFSSSCGLERSSTSKSVFYRQQNPLELKIFDNHFSCDNENERVAPSPPVRKKVSPNLPRVPMQNINTDLQNTTSQFHLNPSSSPGVSGFPKPPQRRISPSNVEKETENSSKEDQTTVKDLIEF